MRAILGGALAAVLCLCTGLSAEDKGEKIDAKKLVGKWEPKEKEEGKSAVIEFTKDGKVSVTISAKGKEFALDGTYKVDGNKVTTTMNFNGKERTETHTVSKLTDT